MADNKKQAEQQGLTRYFTGKPCRHGHICERRVSDSCCVYCHHIGNKKYRDSHQSYIKQYYQEHKISNRKPIDERPCVACGLIFQPKDGGHNAKYCTKSCKERLNKEKEYTLHPERFVPDTRTRIRYLEIKADPEKHKKHLQSGSKSRKKVRQWLANYKLERGCMDCGFKKHYSALQLDHEGIKSISIGHARSSIARLEAEITNGKCVVRCANCHAIKTWERKQTLPNPAQTIIPIGNDLTHIVTINTHPTTIKD